MIRWRLSLLAAILGCTIAIAPALAQGNLAPELAGTDLAGKKQQLSAYRGKWVYVDFWASWCKPCMKEIPAVVDLHRDMAGNSDFAVLGVSLDDSKTMDALQSAIRNNGISYPVICCVAWDSSLMKDWNVQSIPTTFLIDPEGRVVGRDVAPTQVRNLVSRGSSAVPASPVKPKVPPGAPPLRSQHQEKVVQVKCLTRLLEDSPSTGSRGARDLEITVDIAELPQTTHYQLFLRAISQPSGTGTVSESNWRYDLNLVYDVHDKLNPYKIQIGPAQSNPRNNAAPGVRPPMVPEVSVVLDPASHHYIIYVPVLPNTAKLNYAVAQVASS